MISILKRLATIGLVLISFTGPTSARDIRGLAGEFSIGFSPVGHWPDRAPDEARMLSAVDIGYGLGWGVSGVDIVSVSVYGMFSNDYSYRVMYTATWCRFWGRDNRWHSRAGVGHLRSSYDSGSAKNKGGGLLIGCGYEMFTYVCLEGSTFVGLANGDRGTELHGQIQIVAKLLLY